jgi:ABC-type polysaccharide/polyol phosphate transport system ATPase subunit
VAGLGKHFRVPLHRRNLRRTLRALLRRQPLVRDRWVLRDLAFAIEHGEKVAIVGANGSGKSTLLRILCGIYAPSCGAIEVASQPRPLFSAAIGFLADVSARDNVFLYGAVHGVPRRTLAREVDAILEETSLVELQHTPAKDLSTGQLQRLALAIFARTDADFVILDEALANIDEGFRRHAVELFAALAASQRTVIMTAHDTEFLRRFCRRALWLEGGRVRLDGPCDTVLTEYERSFDR